MRPVKGELIDLDSPPPSPTEIRLDDPPSVFEAHQKLVDYQVLSPQKRARKYSAHLRQPKRKCPAIPIEAMNATPADDAHLDSALASDAPTRPPSPPAPAADDAPPTLPPGYPEYMECVTADIAGLSLINSNLFVVQGWDSRTLSVTVSYTYKTDTLPVQKYLVAFMVSFATRGFRRSDGRRLLLSTG